MRLWFILKTVAQAAFLLLCFWAFAVLFLSFDILTRTR